MRSCTIWCEFYRLREFLQRTLQIKLIGESNAQIQVCLRRPRIKLDDFPKVVDSFRRLAKSSKDHGSRRECFGVVRFKTDSRLKSLVCFRKSRLPGQDQSKIDKRLSILRIVLDRLPEQLLRLGRFALLSINDAEIVFCFRVLGIQ